MPSGLYQHPIQGLVSGLISGFEAGDKAREREQIRADRQAELQATTDYQTKRLALQERAADPLSFYQNLRDRLASQAESEGGEGTGQGGQSLQRLQEVDSMIAKLTQPKFEAPIIREFKVGNQTVTKEFDRATRTWRDVSSAPTFKPEKPSEREKKISALQSRYPDMPSGMAEDIVDNVITTNVNPASGNVIFSNKATQQSVVSPMTAQGQNPPIEPTPETGRSENRRTIVDAINENSIGLMGNFQELLGRTAGQIYPNAANKQALSDRNALKRLNQQVLEVFKTSGRVPLQEQQRILSFLPSTGIWESPVSAIESIKGLYSNLVDLQSTEAAISRDPSNGTTSVNNAKRTVQAIDRLLTQIGDVSTFAEPKGVGAAIPGARNQVEGVIGNAKQQIGGVLGNKPRPGFKILSDEVVE